MAISIVDDQKIKNERPGYDAAAASWFDFGIVFQILNFFSLFSKVKHPHTHTFKDLCCLIPPSPKKKKKFTHRFP